MKRTLPLFAFFIGLFGFLPMSAFSQAEWRLALGTYSPTDPDAAGPATGSVTFTYQIRSAGADIPNVSAISTGWSWQSPNAMIPTTAGAGGTGIVAPGCTTVNTPTNVTISAAFAAAGFVFSTVNQCFENTQTTGGQTFDRTVIGTLESNSSITLTTAWTDVFTVTLWTRGNTAPQGGYVIINSTNAGAPGPFVNYEISDNLANPFQANSLTYTTPLALPGAAAPLPVQFTKFNANCSDNGTSITWSTASESNNSHFEIEKSIDGTSWKSIGQLKASPNSNSNKSYQYYDKAGGAATYRVKQVDLDGRAIYTDIVRTSCNTKAFFVNLYPVPAKNNLTLQVGSDRAVKTTVQVVDNFGRVVMSVPISITKGTNNFNLNISHLAQGQYYIRGNQDGFEINQRFTINR